MTGLFKQFKNILAILTFVLVFVTQISVASAAVATTSLTTLANDSRSKEGLTTLLTNRQLESAAKAKADDMFAHQYFAHTSPSGKTPWDFIKSADYSYVYAGENLAIGYDDSTELHNAWMKSASHRANIMNPDYREIGLAKIDGVFDGAQTTIVVQMFGSQTAIAPVTTDKVASTLTALNGSFLPAKIFAGDLVTLKADVTGESQEIYFTIGAQKILVKNGVEKTVVINQEGNLKVTLTAINQAGNQETKELGMIVASKKVVAGANANVSNGSNAGAIFQNTVSILENNLLTVSLTLITLTLIMAGYFLFRQKKYGKFI